MGSAHDTGPYDLFISFNSKEEKEARCVFQLAEKHKLRCFLAPLSLNPGDEWRKKIRGALLASDKICLIATQESSENEWVMAECGAAWALGKEVIPLLLNCSPGDISKFISQEWQAIKYEKYNGFIERVANEITWYEKYIIRRIKNPEHNELFKKSIQIYNLVDQKYRNRISQIKEWIEEDYARTEELYYVASHNENIVGVLYATLCNEEHKCFISTISITPSDEIKKIACAMLEHLKRDVGNLDEECENFYLEIPSREDKRASAELSRCEVILQGLISIWQPKVFKGIQYYQPDLGKRYSAANRKPSQLIDVFGLQAQRVYSRKEFVENVLDFLFKTMYWEAYSFDMNIFDHAEHIMKVYKLIEKTVNEEVHLVPYTFECTA